MLWNDGTAAAAVRSFQTGIFTGGLISGNNQEFQKYATLLMEDALAIVLGTILIYTVVSLLNSRYHRHYNVK